MGPRAHYTYISLGHGLQASNVALTRGVSKRRLQAEHPAGTHMEWPTSGIVRPTTTAKGASYGLRGLSLDRRRRTTLARNSMVKCYGDFPHMHGALDEEALFCSAGVPAATYKQPHRGATEMQPPARPCVSCEGGMKVHAPATLIICAQICLRSSTCPVSWCPRPPRGHALVANRACVHVYAASAAT